MNTVLHLDYGRKDAGGGADGSTEFQAIVRGLEKRDGEIQAFVQKAQGEIKQHGSMLADTKASLEKITREGEELRARLQEVEQKQARRGADGSTREKSWGEQVAESPQYKALAAGQAGKVRISVKATLTTAGASAGALIAPDRRSTPIMLPQRRVRIRDLLSPGRTSSNSINYPRQTTRTNAAATVAEAASKPESALAFEELSAPVRTIAHLLPASKQVLEDAPMLQSIVDNEMLYMLGDVEEMQLLMGDGTSSNIHGVYTQATAFTPPFTIPGPTMIDVLLLAIAQTQAAGYDADGMALNPLDWARILLMKDDGGKYLANGPFGPEQVARLWTLPVATTMAMTLGKFLITTRIGAQIFDREDAVVEMSTEHADFFARNLVMMRAEERLALAVYRPQAFTKGDFATAITDATAA
jgi:HK97 family phage major capsid protein